MTYLALFCVFCLLLHTWAHGDACSAISSPLFLNDPAERALALECLRSIQPMTDPELQQLLDRMDDAADMYAFTDDLRAPALPEFRLQPGAFDESVDLRVDLKGEIRMLRERVYESAFDTYVDLRRLWARARDAHTSMPLPDCFHVLQVVFPLGITPTVTSDHDEEVVLRVSDEFTATEKALLRRAGLDYSHLAGRRVTHIQGVDAYKYLRWWADERTLMGRDPAQRFERLIDIYIRRSDWHFILYPNSSEWFAWPELTSQVRLDHSGFEAGPVWEWKITFEDEEEVVVPFVAFPVSGIKAESGNIISLPASASTIAAELCPKSMEYTPKSRTDYLSITQHNDPLVLAASTPRAHIMQALAEEHARTTGASGEKLAKAAEVNHEVIHPDNDLISLFRSHLSSTTIPPQALAWASYANADVAAALATAPAAADPVVYADSVTVGKYIYLTMPAAPAERRGVCVLNIDTFSPDWQDVPVWLAELHSAATVGRAVGCGTKAAHPLVIRLEQNGGGYVVLMNILFDALWPYYSPHNTYLSILPLRSECTDWAATRLGGLEDPVREPFTFRPVPYCQHASPDARADYAGCGMWWRAGPSVVRSFVEDNGAVSRARFSPATASGVLFWEKPAQFKNLQDWYENGDGADVLGAGNGLFIVATDAITEVGWQPDPDYTTWVGGPRSASCTAHTLNRAQDFRLGRVVVVGGTPDLPNFGRLQSALVGGGNVLSVRESRCPTVFGDDRWPHRNVDVYITTHGSIPYSHPHALNAGSYTSLLEFVPNPPHLVLPLWQSSSRRNTEEGRRELLEALHGLASTHIDTLYRRANFGQTCPGQEGAVMGRNDHGKCGIVGCLYNYAEIGGMCVKQKLYKYYSFPGTNSPVEPSPEQPTKPDDPKKPDDPAKPGQPAQPDASPETPSDPKDKDDSEPQPPTTPAKSNKKTVIRVMLICYSLLGLAGILVAGYLWQEGRAKATRQRHGYAAIVE